MVQNDRVFPTGTEIDREICRLLNLYGPEEICDSMARFFRHDAGRCATDEMRTRYPDEKMLNMICGLLEGAAEHCQEAGMAYYCSTK